MRKESSSKVILISTFLILYASTSYFCKNVISESANTLIFLFAVLLLSLFRENSQQKISAVLIMLLLIVLGLFSSMLARDELKLTVYPIIIYVIAYIYITHVEIEEFTTAFVNIMSFVAFFSVVALLLYMILPRAFSVFPRITNTSGNSAYNLFFAVITPAYLIRAQGFFWEPGAFQTFVNIALSILILKQKRKRWQLIALFSALALSFSTTGYIVGLLNLMLFTVRDYHGKVKNSIKFLFIFIMLAIALYLLYPIIPRTLYGQTLGFAKIEKFLEGPSSNTIDSASVRFDSIYYPSKLFLANPIFGAGQKGLEGLSSMMGHSMVTCTPINYFAMYGILYGLIVMICIYKFAKTVTPYRLTSIILFAIFIISMISEQYVNYLIIDIFIMYGAASIKLAQPISYKRPEMQVGSYEAIGNK